MTQDTATPEEREEARQAAAEADRAQEVADALAESIADARGVATPSIEGADKMGELLIRNGYAHVRGAIVQAVSGAEGIPLEAYDACIAYCEQQIAALRLAEEQNPDLIAAGLGELDVLKIGRKTRQALKDLAERRAARAAITR